jgi:hypothetical protein
VRMATSVIIASPLGALALHADALVRAPDPDLGNIGLADLRTRARASFPAFVVYGRPMTSHSPVSSISRSPI